MVLGDCITPDCIFNCVKFMVSSTFVLLLYMYYQRSFLFTFFLDLAHYLTFLHVQLLLFINLCTYYKYTASIIEVLVLYFRLLHSTVCIEDRHSNYLSCKEIIKKKVPTLNAI